ACDHKFGLLGVPETENTSAAPVRCDNAGMAFNVEGQALRSSQTREETVNCTARRNSVNGIETRRGRPRDVQIIVKTERQVVRGDARFECCKNKNLFRGADLENTAAAVAYIEVAVMIESDSGGDTHAFDEQF